MTIKSFDNVEDLFEELNDQRAQAREKAANLQSFLEKFREPGTCFIQLHEYGFIIYARVEGSPYEEDQELLESSFRDGYLFCLASSAACPEGELGSIHVSRIHAVLSPEGYQWAKEHNWPAEVTTELQSFIQTINPDMGFH